MCMHNYLIFTAVAGSGLLLDQATKLYIAHNMALYTSIPVIGSIFNITYVQSQSSFRDICSFHPERRMATIIGHQLE